MKTTIKLRIELCLGNEIPETLTVNVKGELPDVGTQIIDTSEKALLELFFPIMRQTLEQHLQGVSRRTTADVQADHGGTMVLNTTLYRVDGELGRVAFPTYALRHDGAVIWNSAAKLFGAQGPREYYHTAGMRQLTLSLTSAMSYRDSAGILNAVRHTDHPTPVTTLAAMVEREGAAVQAWIDHRTATTLADHAFTEQGTPSAETTIEPLTADQGRLPQAIIDQAFRP